MSRARLAVLVSGRGSNLEALRSACESGLIPADIVLVGSNRPHAPALGLAHDAGIATLASDSRGCGDRAAWDRAFLADVAAFRPDWIVLAGFMRQLDGSALSKWIGRMINIHPSLLPKYPGLGTHRRALEAGEREHGASVHFVTAELEGGPILAQVRMPIQQGDTPDSLGARLLPLEHRLLVASVAFLLRHRVELLRGCIWLEGIPMSEPLQLDEGLALR